MSLNSEDATARNHESKTGHALYVGGMALASHEHL